MSRKSAEWLLAGVIFARSTSLLFAKVGLESMSPLNLLAVRFCLAFAVLCVIFWKKLRTTTKTDLLHGMILGAVFFAVMTCETFALTRTHASTVSFLVNTAIVIVPLFEAALHRKAPDHRTLLCAAVTLAGTPHLPQNGTEWGVILALALVCSCFGFTFQPVAQRYTTADRAAQLCAINPLSTAVLSAIFLQERMGVQGIIGAALILLGIVLHNYHKAGADAGAMAEGETSHAA